jgi:hypothetical protein
VKTDGIEGVGGDSDEGDMSVGFFIVFVYHDLKSSSQRLPVFEIPCRALSLN